MARRRPLLLVAAAAHAAVAARVPGGRDLSAYGFEDYVGEFAKAYRSGAEREERRRVFEANLADIRAQNARPGRTWAASVNQFSDWTNEEFRARRTRPRVAPPPGAARGAGAAASADLPSSVDWREHSPAVVTDVKNQGECGSCWAVSATESMESHLALATKRAAVELSVQQVVSCTPNPDHCGGAGGCDGDIEEDAFNYTARVGITTEDAYPYDSGDDGGYTLKCKNVTKKRAPVARNRGHKMLPPNDYNALMTAVATIGPISIGVAAGTSTWQNYHSGVVSEGNGKDACGWDMDHAVQLVGYGTEKGLFGHDYWLVRNSWGEYWGEDGYIRLRRYGDGKEPCGTDTTPGDGNACKGDTTPVRMCGVCGILGGGSTYPTNVTRV